MIDYKEKYEQGLECLEEILNSGQEKIKMTLLKERLLPFFPELDSEDEQIRKGLIKALSSIGKRNWGGIDVFESIAWLEKQDEQKPIMNVPTREVILAIWDLGNEWKELTDGDISTEYGTQLDYIQKHWHESEYYLREKQDEQKPPVIDFKAKNWYVSEVDGKIHDLTYNPTDKVEPKFKVGDWILYSGDHYEGVRHITKIDENGYYIERNGLPHGIIPFEHEICMTLWTIQNAKDGDVLAGSKNDVILMFRGIGNTEWDDVIDYHCYYDCYRKDFIVQEDVKYWGNIENNQLKPATKEQRDLLFSKMKEAGYEWNAEKKELKKIVAPQPKFKVGDWIANDYCTGKVIALTDDAYLLDSGQGIPFSCEHNTHLWTIQDAKDGDMLAAQECYVIFKEIDGLNIKCHCTYHYMGLNPSFHINTLQNKTAFHPSTKEERDLLFQKMKEAGYQWDDEKKELKKIGESENIKNQIMSEITDLVKDYIRQKSTCDNEDGDIIIFSK